MNINSRYSVEKMISALLFFAKLQSQHNYVDFNLSMLMENS